MAKHVLNRLKEKKLATDPGRHADGGGLWLYVSPEGNRSWVFRWTRDGKRREMGIGAAKLSTDKDGVGVTLEEARGIAAQSREFVKQGRDPISEKRREAEPTFDECCTKFIDAMEHQWRNEKHRKQWRSTLKAACKDFASVPVSQVSTEHVLGALTPIWKTAPETASRTRGRIERVLDYASTKGWRSGPNPALWRGHLRNVLPPAKKLSRGHHTAMPYDDLPGFITKLHDETSLSAQMLELTILTASRTGEIQNARWPEFDLKAAVWTIPAERMKAGKAHRVPLAQRAVDLLTKLKEQRRSELVFEGKKDKPLSNMAMAMLMRRMEQGQYTVHGFRSAFRDWCGDKTSFPREIAEQALAHTVGNAVELSYRRSDALERRRELMNAWARYLEPTQGNVVKLQAS